MLSAATGVRSVSVSRGTCLAVRGRRTQAARDAEGDRHADEGRDGADDEAELEGALGRDLEAAEALVWLVSRVPITAAASVVPTERIRALRPTADAASRIGAVSRIRVGIAAYPMPTPAEATQEATSSCHGASIRKNATR